MKRHSVLESLKRLVPEMPRLLPAGQGTQLHFASSGGGGGPYDDPDDDYYDDIPDEPARRDDTQATAGRRRTVQSEPNDRYWTDYLRIALPVIGLLLVIAVFWYWAQQLIDDDGNGDITPTEAGIAEVVETATVEAPETTASPTESPATQPGQPVTPPTTVPTDNQQPEQPTPTPTPEPEEPATDAGSDNQVADIIAAASGVGEIEPDMMVVVTEDGGGLALRSEASAQGGEETVVTRLDAGTELRVASGPEQAENYTWWQVVVTTTGDQGWVVEEFITPVE